MPAVLSLACSMGNEIGKRLENHHEGARNDQHEAERGLFGQPLMEHDGGKCDGDQNAQLIDGHDHAGKPVLQRLVVAQPRAACRKAGQADEAELLLRDLLQRVLLALDEHNEPRHHEHDARADGRAEVGLHALNANLAENGRQAGEHGGENGIDQPALSFGLVSGDCFFLDHQERADGDEHDGRALEPGDALAQEEERQRDRQDGARFIDGNDLVHVAELQRAEIAQPRRAGREAREDQKDPRLRAQAGDGRRGADDGHHQPRKQQDHDRPDGRGRVGIRLPNAAFCQNGCQPGKKRRTKCKQDPHDNAFFLYFVSRSG